MVHHSWVYCIFAGLAGVLIALMGLVVVIFIFNRFYKLLRKLGVGEEGAVFGILGTAGFIAAWVMVTLTCKGIIK